MDVPLDLSQEPLEVFEPWTEPRTAETPEDPREGADVEFGSAPEAGPDAPVAPPPVAEVGPATAASQNGTAPPAVDPSAVEEADTAADSAPAETAPAVGTTSRGPTRRRHRPKPRFVATPVRRPPPDPATHPVDFLKRVVVAEMQAVARRLDAAQHYTTVQDLLDLPTPTLRVLIWPKPGLLDSVPGRILATMELCLNEATGTLTTSYWWGTRPGDVIPMAQAPATELSLEWTRSQMLDFLQVVLSQV